MSNGSSDCCPECAASRLCSELMDAKGDLSKLRVELDSTQHDREEVRAWGVAWRSRHGELSQENSQLRAELAAAENLVTALTTQRAADAVAAMRAVAEAREETRALIAGLFATFPGADGESIRFAILATPLDATPLRERIAELEAERTEFLKADAINLADWKDHQKRAEKAEARVKELEALRPNQSERSDLKAHLSRTTAERDALKAELAALTIKHDKEGDRLSAALDNKQAQVERLHNALTRFIKAHGIKREDDPAWSFATVDMYEFEHAEKVLKESNHD